MPSFPARLHIVGEIRSSEDLLIEGEVRGNIHAPMGVVTIADHARVDADIHAKQIHVHGTVRGALFATERIAISASASVRGNVSADYVVITEGAFVNGHIDMNRRTIASRVERHRATEASNASASI